MIEKQFTALLRSFVQDTGAENGRTVEHGGIAAGGGTAEHAACVGCMKTSVGGSRRIRKFAADWTVFCTVRLSAT